MRVALVGPTQSGKSTLFAAVAEAGGSHVDLHRPDQPHLAVVKVPDDRLDWLAEHYQRDKAIHAELEFVDLPGLDLSSEAGRHHAKVHWSAMRQCDMLAFVVREFEAASVPAYRGQIDPAADLQELQEELIFADLDQATTRVEKLQTAVKKRTAKQDEQLHELDLMQRMAAALEAEKKLADAVQSEAEEKLLRSFAFLSLKPALVVRNVSEKNLNRQMGQTLAGVPCVTLSAKIEEEIAQLPPEQRDEFLSDLGFSRPARDRLIRACYAGMNLVSFLTVGDKEVRAWSVPSGTDAVTAAGHIHSDIARGFIRAETVHFDDLRAAGDMKTAKAAGKVRLEGKGYIVQDGDVILFRFNV